MATIELSEAMIAFSDGQLDCEQLPASATAPLGLTGRYHVTGLYELRERGKLLEPVARDFDIDLAPTSSALDVLTEAAKQHKQAFGVGDHIFVESFDINDQTIEIGIGS